METILAIIKLMPKKTGVQEPTLYDQENTDIAPGGIRKGAAGYDITLLHLKANEQFPIAGEGVLIELVKASPEVIMAPSALVASSGDHGVE